MLKALKFWTTFYGRHTLPYLTRISLTPQTPWGKLFFHVFHREDEDDLHDHPSDFWTFPLVSYVEHVRRGEFVEAETVKAFRWHRRPAEHSHRILHAIYWDRHGIFHYLPERKIYTLFWRCHPVRRTWGFWVPRKPRKAIVISNKVVVMAPRSTFRFVPWKKYLGVQDAA